ncbi:hypothetical protein ES332_A11G135500v1 [Gossypium tomentosum]|nr:hypothetical protein ES332_A11G135500v1 [Gossypium tomentosum]
MEGLLQAGSSYFYYNCFKLTDIIAGNWDLFTSNKTNGQDSLSGSTPVMKIAHGRKSTNQSKLQSEHVVRKIRNQ